MLYDDSCYCIYFFRIFQFVCAQFIRERVSFTSGYSGKPPAITGTRSQTQQIPRGEFCFQKVLKLTISDPTVNASQLTIPSRITGACRGLHPDQSDDALPSFQ